MATVVWETHNALDGRTLAGVTRVGCAESDRGYRGISCQSEAFRGVYRVLKRVHGVVTIADKWRRSNAGVYLMNTSAHLCPSLKNDIYCVAASLRTGVSYPERTTPVARILLLIFNNSQGYM